MTKKDVEARFKKIMELYGPVMHRSAFKILKNKEDAEEIVQDTLYRLIKNNTAPDEDDEHAAAILVVAAKNMALNYYSKLVRRKTVGYEEAINTDNTGYRDTAIEDRIAVEQCIARLPARQKEYILLKYHQDLSLAEIAELKGKSEKSVYAVLERAIANLRVMMNE